MPDYSQLEEGELRHFVHRLVMKEAIRRILVPLDPSIYAEAATETACRIGQKHQASLSGVAVLDSKGIRSSMVPAIGPYYPMMIDAVQAKVKHADHVLKDCMARFATACEEAQVQHEESEYEGIPAQKLLETSIFYDLVVIGLETSFHFETESMKSESLDKIIDRTVTPILAVPAKGLEDPKKVLITFDGSVGSSQALHDFVAFAGPYDEMEVVVVTAGLKNDEAKFLLRNAAEFLRLHGVRKVETVPSEKSIESFVTDDFLRDIDLVVAGIHSRKFLKDYFVGSFTKKLIQRCDTALFLSH